ncbi:MAG: hypothetical protein V2B17_01365, partial [Chloroflexota bacterium]
MAESDRPQLTQVCTAGPGPLPAAAPGAARTSWFDAAQTFTGSGRAVARREAHGAAADPGAWLACGSGEGQAGASGQSGRGAGAASGATTRQVGCSMVSAGA